MPDNKREVAPQDASRININENYEVQYWTNALGCSEEELVRAVKEVGVSAEAVRKKLGK